MTYKRQRPAGRPGAEGSHLDLCGWNYRANRETKQRSAHAAAGCYCRVTGVCLTCAYWNSLIRFLEGWRATARRAAWEIER
jgi:hypothetical protein